MSTKFEDISYDLVDGIYDVLNNFVFKEVDTITLSGTSGTATILNNGITKTATFATSKTLTASNFVTTNAAAYLAAGTVLTSLGEVLTFTAFTPGTGFTGATTITNATLTLSGTVASADITYPILKSIPKPAPDNYIYAGGVIQTEDGTKDDFHYLGSVTVKVVTDNLSRADKKLAQQILNVIRGLLKPKKSSVFSLHNHTLITFSHESMTPVEEQNEAIIKISLNDLYNFLIQ